MILLCFIVFHNFTCSTFHWFWFGWSGFFHKLFSDFFWFFLVLNVHGMNSMYVCRTYCRWCESNTWAGWFCCTLSHNKKPQCISLGTMPRNISISISKNKRFSFILMLIVVRGEFEVDIFFFNIFTTLLIDILGVYNSRSPTDATPTDCEWKIIRNLLNLVGISSIMID